MSDRNFKEMLEAQWSRDNFVCVGLDPQVEKLPKPFRLRDTEYSVTTPRNQFEGFNRRIVEATYDLVCAYKPNLPFYAAHGAQGIEALWRTVKDIHTIAPDVPVILDSKNADIGSTNNGYVSMAFNYLGADAITVNPYLGAEALEPFLALEDKGIIVVCRTSNPGAGEFQDLDIILSDEEKRRWGIGGGGLEAAPVKLYEYVAYRVSHEWNRCNNCAIVVGATYPDELRQVREIIWDMPILIPGVGFQQPDVSLEKQVEQVVSAGKDNRGWGMIVNSSRGIIYASQGADFAEAARRETENLRDLINQYR